MAVSCDGPKGMEASGSTEPPEARGLQLQQQLGRSRDGLGRQQQGKSSQRGGAAHLLCVEDMAWG